MLKIYIFELTSPICDKDKSFFLSELDSSEIETLPKLRGKKFEVSLIGQIMTKQIVSNETLIPKENILISKTKFGKPIIKRPSGSNLDISISHSGNYLVIGICDIGKVGIDIELLKNIDFRVFKNCLSVDEERYINSGKEVAQRLANFYEIWTRKEACLKASGIGLQKPLPIMRLYPDRIKLKAEIRYNSQQYYLSTLKKKNFIVSICTTRPTTYCHSHTKLTPNTLAFVVNNKMVHSKSTGS